MKIKRKSKSFSHLPLVTQELILRIVDKSVEEIVAEIEKVDFWHYGKYELGYWIDVLDTFDYILSTVTSGHDTIQQECGLFMCPKLTNPVVKSQVLAVLNFTSLLIQHSYSGHNIIYNSTEHLCILLASADLDIVLAVLNLLCVLGKDFMLNLPTQLMNNLRSYLEFLGEAWGGDEKGFGLVQCCRDISMDGFPPITSSVYFEYHPHSEELSETLPELMSRLTQGHSISSMEMMHLMTRLRYAKNCTDPHRRRKCVLIRLLAISVLLVCSKSSDKVMVYNGLMEELVEVLKMKDFEIQSSDQGDSNSEVDEETIQIQGSSQKRGLKRKISNDFSDSETKSIKKCQMNVGSSAQQTAPRHEVSKVENANSEQLEGGVFNEDNVIQGSETTTTLEQEIRIAVFRSLTAIVSLKRDDILSTIVEVTGASMYHGFLPTLIRDCIIAITDEDTATVPNSVVGGYLLKFVTAMFSFVYHLGTCVAGGNPLVNSGVLESLLLVIQFRATQPMNISLVTSAVRVVDAITNQDPTAFHRFKGWEKIVARLKMEVDACQDDVPDVLSSSVITPGQSDTDPVPMETNTMPPFTLSSTSDVDFDAIHCMAERSMLIECILELLLKVTPEFEENIRNFVNSSLPSSLEHIISNAEYYALKVFSMVICHDPSQLSSLQDSGLPWIIMNSLIRKKIPVAPEVLDALPEVLNAICINSRGLQTFIDCDPFDHLFKVLVTPEYLLMKRQNNETHTRTLGKTLGSAMYELLKKRPLLIPSAIGSLIKLLCVLGNDVSTDGIKGNQDEGSCIQSESLQSETADTLGNSTRTGDSGVKNKTTTPSLSEYVQNIMDFIGCCMSHRPRVLNEFISRGGLQPLISLLVLPGLPSSFISSSSRTFAILALHQCTAHEGAVMDEGFSQFSNVLSELIPFTRLEPDEPPLPRTVAAADGYIKLFIELAKDEPLYSVRYSYGEKEQPCFKGTSQQISIKKWASPQGQKVFDQLAVLHHTLVWEECLYIVNQEQTTPTIMNSLTSGEAGVNEDKTEDQRKSVQGSASSNPLMSGIKDSLAILLKLLVDVCRQHLKRCSIVKFDDSLLEECITVGLKVADLVNDCLTWDQSTFGVVSKDNSSDPCYSKHNLEHARIVHETFAVKTCKALVFDERKKSFHLILHCFNERRVLDRLVSSFRFVLTCCVSNVQGEVNHSAATSDFFGVWFELCEMLIDTTRILDSTHTLFIPSPCEDKERKLSHNPLFDPLMFIAETQKAIVSCAVDLWPPVNIGAPVLPVLMKTIIQCYKCETVIKENLNNLNYSCDLSKLSFVKDASSPTQILADQLLECVLGQVSYVCDVFSTSCDLLVTLMKRGDSVWRYKALMAVKEKALRTMVCLCDRISDGSYNIKDGVQDPSSHYIWLLTTLLTEVPLASGPVLCQADLLQSCCKLLVLTQQKLLSGEERFINPMWLVPLLLMLEVWISIKYTAMFRRPVPEGHVAVWLWFDNAKNEWCYYPDEVSSQIETAYQNNRDTCKVSMDKHKHKIQFSSMTELNKKKSAVAVQRLEVPEKVKHATKSLDDSTNSIIKKEVPSWYCPLSKEQAVLIVTHCTRLLSVPLEPTTLHANMRLLVSLTRDPHLASVFMSERGPHTLLSLTRRRSCFNGFSSLSSLLFRHVLEDSNLLGYCMDSVICEVIMGNPNDDLEEVKVHNSRDLDYVLRRLAPCVCRDQELFMKIAGERMRLLDEPIPLTDYSNTTQLHPVRLQYEPQQNIEPFVLTSVQTNLLSMLVDHFCNPGFTEDVLLGDQFQESHVQQGRQDNKVKDDDKMASDDNGNDLINESRSNMVLELKPVSNTCQTGSTGMVVEESSSNQELSSVNDIEKGKTTSSESIYSEPMLTQTCTLRLLAEIIVSYPVFAKTILESSREIKVQNTKSNDTKVVMSLLTLILDYLLPASYIRGCRTIKVVMFARIFLLTLASTTLPEDALMLFINEIKSSFAHALSLPESLIKHQRIQAIAGLLDEIIEPPFRTSFRSRINPTQFVLLLIRRGFITDLSKAIHSMDLSSSFLSTTINTILKPLESLTRIITQFLNAQKKGLVTWPGSNTTMATKDAHSDSSYPSTDDLEVELIQVIHNDDDEGDDRGGNSSFNYYEEPSLFDPKDIDKMHNNPYHGQRSNIIQQFLLSSGDGPNPRHSNIDRSEPFFSSTFDSTIIPTNISRWREESIALDGATAFLRVADLRSPLLAILSDELLSIDQVVRMQQLNEAVRTMPTPQPPYETCFQSFIQHVLANSTSTRDAFRIMQEGKKRKVEDQKRYESQVLNTRFVGKPIVDHEGLTCLLAMLFLGQSCANFSGLFKVIRSLSQHVPSCTWLITSLLSILKKITHTCPIPSEMLSCTSRSESHWLNMTVPNVVHGSRIPVFSFTSSEPVSLSDVTIHPCASESIYDITLDLMIFLARQFPSAFLPLELAPKHNQLLCDPSTCFPSDFWQILFYLDSSLHGGKDVVKGSPHPDPPSAEEQALSDVFSQSPIGVLMRCLASPIVQGNVNRIKMVLRILVVISGAIPKHGLGTEDSKEAVRATSEDGSYSRGLETSSDPSSKGLGMSKTPLGPVHTVPLCYSSSVVSVDLLNSVIDLLTSGECNKDLLENATNLLMNLSQCSDDTRETILLMLLNGVKKIGNVLFDQISALLMELRSKMSSLSASLSSSTEEYTANNTVPSLGSMEGVVLSAAQGSGQDTTPTQQDLHLSCMKPFVCKDSQQSFFLRLLKAVLQLSCSSQATPTNYVLPSNKPESAANEPHTVPLSIQLDLEELWTTLSDCLDALSGTYDPHAVLVLQPTLESFFLIHADHSQGVRSTHTRYVSSHTKPCTTSDTETSVKSSTIFNASSPFLEEDTSSASSATLSPNMARFLQFAARHRTVLNQILRQTTTPLSKGCFAVLVNHTHLLDLDIKRRYFRYELDQLDKDVKRKHITICVRRDHVFEDSYDAFSIRSSDKLIKGNLRIIFEGEEGVDAGGLLREWYLIIAREMFNPNNALFKSPGDRATYTPNPASYINHDHLKYFRFIGRLIAKAIYDNKLLDCYFTRSFYKHILGKPVHYTDMESEDNAFYRSMVFLLDHEVDEFGTELTFSTEINEFGETIVKDLKPNGRDIPVTESNKKEYVQLVCQMKMTGSIHKQITSFLEGFYEIIPKSLISIFNEQELELLISGLPHFDLNDLKANTEYCNYTETSLQIQWFWRALRSYSQADRTQFLQFVTGTSKVPLQGFVALEGMNGIQKFRIYRDDRSTDRLPTAHTCFNHLDLPPYETYDKLYRMLLTAIRECPEGYGFA